MSQQTRSPTLDPQSLSVSEGGEGQEAGDGPLRVPQGARLLPRQGLRGQEARGHRGAQAQGALCDACIQRALEPHLTAMPSQSLQPLDSPAPTLRSEAAPMWRQARARCCARSSSATPKPRPPTLPLRASPTACSPCSSASRAVESPNRARAAAQCRRMRAQNSPRCLWSPERPGGWHAWRNRQRGDVAMTAIGRSPSAFLVALAAFPRPDSDAHAPPLAAAATPFSPARPVRLPPQPAHIACEHCAAAAASASLRRQARISRRGRGRTSGHSGRLAARSARVR